MTRTFFVGGNWKMNGSLQLIQTLITAHLGSAICSRTQVVIAPPAPYLVHVRDAAKDLGIQVAAQNVHEKLNGAFTGEISVLMLKDLGIGWTLLGHSERRQHFYENNQRLGEKLETCLAQHISVIFCIGETLGQRQSGETVRVLHEQLQPLLAAAKSAAAWETVVVAYEPVWAIGTGVVATAEQAQDAHQQIRAHIAAHSGDAVAQALRIIYGGSVTASNCRELAGLADVGRLSRWRGVAEGRVCRDCWVCGASG